MSVWGFKRGLCLLSCSHDGSKGEHTELLTLSVTLLAIEGKWKAVLIISFLSSKKTSSQPVGWPPVLNSKGASRVSTRLWQTSSFGLLCGCTSLGSLLKTSAPLGTDTLPDRNTEKMDCMWTTENFFSKTWNMVTVQSSLVGLQWSLCGLEHTCTTVISLPVAKVRAVCVCWSV